jgi:hypothetical protein
MQTINEGFQKNKNIFVILNLMICFLVSSLIFVSPAYSLGSAKKTKRAPIPPEETLTVSEMAQKELSKIKEIKSIDLSSDSYSKSKSKSKNKNKLAEKEKSKEEMPKEEMPKEEVKGVFTVHEKPILLTQRNWNYVLGLKLQKFQPTGQIHSDLVGDFNLNHYEEHLFPTMEVGFSKDFKLSSEVFCCHVLAQVGYNSFQVPYIFASGYKAPENTRLTSMRVGWGIEAEKQVFYPELKAHSGISLGRLYYTQTSMNDLAQFSEGYTYSGWNIGLNYPVLPWLQLSGDYIYRSSFLSQNKFFMDQKHNFDLGMRIKW